MQKKHISERRMTPFQTYLISDIVLVVLVLLTMTPFISKALQESNDRMQESLHAAAVRTLEPLDSLISNMESIMISNHDEAFLALRRLSSENRQPKDYYTMRKVTESISTLVTANASIYDLLISYPAGGVTLRSGSCFDSTDAFRGYFHADDFYEEAFDSAQTFFLPARRLSYGSQQTSVDVFGYRFSFDRFGSMRACLLIYTGDYMNDELLRTIGEGGSAVLSSADGTVIYQMGVETTAEDESRFITVQDSSLSGRLTLTLRTPRMLPSATLAGVISRLLLCLVAAFSVGVLYSVLSARRHALPVKRLVGELSQYNKEMQATRSRMTAMQKLTESLQQEKNQFATQLEEFRQTRLESAVTRLFTASSISQEDVEYLRQALGELPQRYFVAYGRMEPMSSGADYQDELGLILRSMLREHLPETCPIYMPDARSVAVLMEESMLAERDELTAAFPDILWSFSRSYHGERFVATALEEARMTHEFKGRERTTLSIQIFQRIYNSVVAGDDAEADLQMDEAFACADADNIRFLYGGLRFILYLVASEYGSPVNAPPFDPTQPPETHCNVLRQAVHLQCGEINMRKKSRNEDRKKRVLQYIQENYSDSSLYAPAIAEEVGISEKYLYNFVKEQTGFSLGEYLMHLRMSKAAEILAQQDMPIKEICYAVGFNSENSFYKAFKRSFGVTPTQYRTTHRQTVVDR